MNKYYTLILLFLLIITAPLLTYVVPITSTKYANRENRNLTKFPQLNINSLDQFPGDFDRYFDDNFNFRGEFLKLNNFVKLNLYKESPHNAVILGKQGWMYTRKYINSYISKKIFSTKELDSIRGMYVDRSTWLKEKNIKNYVFIIPTKYNIYNEYLPSPVYKLRKTNEKEQFINSLNGIDNLKVIDLLPTLQNHKKKSPIRLYHKTDQHWNEYGAFIAYTKIIEELHQDFPEIPLVNTNDFIIDSVITPGKSLAKTVLLEDKVDEVVLKVKPRHSKSVRFSPENDYKVTEIFPYKNEFQIHYKTERHTLPKIMLVRDSYANSLLKVLPESFNETVFIWDNWCYRLNEDIVENEKPDIYVTIVIESNLSYILHKHPSER